ncbi:MAG TPA: nitroreductase/quinone reductase family protein [Streptosporangiaceae bacterium]|jgi:deazaflavin-dependent oxidoreductase (nitroreductase family)|nr:nitroreductase/quinone reductase family protein [Streptosporangiaceae bacterium]
MTMARDFRMSTARRLGNAMISRLVARGIGPKDTYLLTVGGRTTGLPRTTPVLVLTRAGERWLVAPYGVVSWVRNVRAAGKVTLRKGGTVETVGVTEVGPEEAGPVLKDYVEKVRIVRPYFDAAPGAPAADFAAEASRHPVFRIGAPAA